MTLQFELPIYYTKEKQLLENNIIEDLELLETNQDDETRDSLLKLVFNPKTELGKNLLKKQVEYFTTNKEYLKETQHIISKWNSKEEKTSTKDEFLKLWKDIKNDEHFIDRYYYVDINYFKFLNKSSLFLQLLSIYNLMSPVLTLLIPVFLLIVPFFMLKFMGIKIDVTNYFSILKKVFSKHALGNIFNLTGNIPIEKKVYALVSIGFYIFSIYQNVLICYRFFNNFQKIHNNLFMLHNYLKLTIHNCETIETMVKNKNTYHLFLQGILENKSKYNELYEKVKKIKQLSWKNVTSKTCEIGYVMKLYYDLHTDEEIKNLIEFSFGLNGYKEHMDSLGELYKNKQLNKSKFGKKMNVVETFNPYLINDNPIKNDIKLDKNIIITGPNASGKTTLLKTVLINQIFSQCFGCGFFKKATIPIYDSIHCYLNIPDTSGRDSLFQAEAKRCKQIIDSLEDNKKHFCIFDELFSGTNPTEACASSYGFIKYLNTQKIDFLLTTHLVDLCKELKNDVKHCNMKVNQINNFEFDFTYKVEKGISTIKGGLKVLNDLRFPEQIIKNSCNYLKI